MLTYENEDIVVTMLKALRILHTRDVEAVIFQQLPLSLTKNEKTTVDNFF